MKGFYVVMLSIFSCGILYGGKVENIKIEKKEGNLMVIIFTDAEEYKAFTLPDSERVVIDFIDSRSHLPSQIQSPYSPLLRIRTSQYKLKPVPITRVVLDLKHKISYSISRTAQGMEINLGKVEEELSQIVKPELPPPVKKAETKDTIKPVLPAPTVKEDTVKKVGLPSGKSFFYNPRGKRDPFKPYLGVATPKDTLLDVSTATIVGIMWSPEDRYALAEDKSGKAFILMEGDPVSGGKVLKIEKKEVTFLMHVFGGTKKVTLKIIPKKEKE